MIIFVFMFIWRRFGIKPLRISVRLSYRKVSNQWVRSSSSNTPDWTLMSLTFYIRRLAITPKEVLRRRTVSESHTASMRSKGWVSKDWRLGHRTERRASLRRGSSDWQQTCRWSSKRWGTPLMCRLALSRRRLGKIRRKRSICIRYRRKLESFLARAAQAAVEVR